MRVPRGAMEAAGAMDERNGPLAHSALENASRFPQLPQPSSSGVSQRPVPTRAGHSLADPFRGLECGVHLKRHGTVAPVSAENAENRGCRSQTPAISRPSSSTGT